MRSAIVSATVAAVFLLAGCQRARSDGAAVENAWVRLAAVPGRPAAAYFTLRGGGAAERLASVASPAAQRAELHEGGMSDGMMTMRPIDGVDLPAAGTIAFRPGGDHVMLFGVDPMLKPGATMALRFRFASGAGREAQARIVAAGDPAPTFAH